MMKKSKFNKLALLLIIVVLCATVFVACFGGGSDNKEEAKTKATALYALYVAEGGQATVVIEYDNYKFLASTTGVVDYTPVATDNYGKLEEGTTPGTYKYTPATTPPPSQDKTAKEIALEKATTLYALYTADDGNATVVIEYDGFKFLASSTGIVDYTPVVTDNYGKLEEGTTAGTYNYTPAKTGKEIALEKAIALYALYTADDGEATVVIEYDGFKFLASSTGIIDYTPVATDNYGKLEEGTTAGTYNYTPAKTAKEIALEKATALYALYTADDGEATVVIEYDGFKFLASTTGIVDYTPVATDNYGKLEEGTTAGTYNYTPAKTAKEIATEKATALYALYTYDGGMDVVIIEIDEFKFVASRSGLVDYDSDIHGVVDNYAQLKASETERYVFIPISIPQKMATTFNAIGEKLSALIDLPRNDNIKNLLAMFNFEFDGKVGTSANTAYNFLGAFDGDAIKFLMDNGLTGEEAKTLVELYAWLEEEANRLYLFGFEELFYIDTDIYGFIGDYSDYTDSYSVSDLCRLISGLPELVDQIKFDKTDFVPVPNAVGTYALSQTKLNAIVKTLIMLDSKYIDSAEADEMLAEMTPSLIFVFDTNNRLTKVQFSFNENYLYADSQTLVTIYGKREIIVALDIDYNLVGIPTKIEVSLTEKEQDLGTSTNAGKTPYEGENIPAVKIDQTKLVVELKFSQVFAFEGVVISSYDNDKIQSKLTINLGYTDSDLTSINLILQSYKAGATEQAERIAKTKFDGTIRLTYTDDAITKVEFDAAIATTIDNPEYDYVNNPNAPDFLDMIFEISAELNLTYTDTILTNITLDLERSEMVLAENYTETSQLKTESLIEIELNLTYTETVLTKVELEINESKLRGVSIETEVYELKPLYEYVFELNLTYTETTLTKVEFVANRSTWFSSPDENRISFVKQPIEKIEITLNLAYTETMLTKVEAVIKNSSRMLVDNITNTYALVVAQELSLQFNLTYTATNLTNVKFEINKSVAVNNGENNQILYELETAFNFAVELNLTYTESYLTKAEFTAKVIGEVYNEVLEDYEITTIFKLDCVLDYTRNIDGLLTKAEFVVDIVTPSMPINIAGEFNLTYTAGVLTKCELDAIVGIPIQNPEYNPDTNPTVPQIVVQPMVTIDAELNLTYTEGKLTKAEFDTIISMPMPDPNYDSSVDQNPPQMVNVPIITIGVVATYENEQIKTVALDVELSEMISGLIASFVKVPMIPSIYDIDITLKYDAQNALCGFTFSMLLPSAEENATPVSIAYFDINIKNVGNATNIVIPQKVLDKKEGVVDIFRFIKQTKALKFVNGILNDYFSGENGYEKCDKMMFETEYGYVLYDNGRLIYLGDLSYDDWQGYTEEYCYVILSLDKDTNIWRIININHLDDCEDTEDNTFVTN